MADITTGLLSHWKLDETGTTTTAVDSGSAGNDLTLAGFLSVADAWADDEGLFFAGANESDNDTATYSVITDYDNPAVTLTFRHKRVQPDSTFQIVFGIAFNFCIGFETDGSLIVYVYDGSTYQQNPLAGATKILDTNWHHIAATWDNATDTLKIYIDGVLETTTVLTGTTISYTSTDESGILVGGGATGYRGHGNFSNARIYSRALPLADVVAVAAADEPPPLWDIVSNLEGWWKFDESGGDAAVIDSSSNSFDLVLTNITNVAAARAAGNGTEFDGDDDIALGIGYNSDFEFTEFTVSAWVEMGSAGRSGEWIFGSSNDLGLYIHFGCVVAYVYHGSGVYTGTVDNIEDISDNTWHHIAARWSDTTGIITVFLDGVELRSTDSSGKTISYVHNDSDDINFGHWYDGKIADARWYSRALADADVAQLSNISPDDPPAVSEIGLIAEWLFNEAASGTAPTTVYDGIGNGDLSIDYDTNANWVDTDGRGIDYDDTSHSGGLSVLNIPTNASDISTGLGSACQKASLIFVGEDLYGVSNGGRLFVLGTSTGNGQLAITLNDLGQTHELRYAEDDGTGFRFEFDNTYFNDGTNVFIMVVDTTQAALLDRVKLYKNGTIQTATRTADCGSNSGQNATADFTGSTCNLNIMNRGDEQRRCTGVVHYAALCNDALSAAQALAISTALLLDSDSTIEAPPNPFAGAFISAGGEIQSGAVIISLSHDLGARDLVSAGAIESGAIISTHVLQADDLESSSSIESAGISTSHALSASNLSSTPDIEPGAISSRHILSTSNLVSSSSIESGGISQRHVLSALNLSSTSDIESGEISHRHVLSALDLVSDGAIESGGISSRHILSARNLVSSGLIESASLAQPHILSADDLVSGGLIESGAISISHLLQVGDLESTQEIESGAIGHRHLIQARDLVNAGSIESAGITQIYTFSITDADGDNEIQHGQVVDIHCQNAGAKKGIVDYGGIEQVGVTWLPIAVGSSTISVAAINAVGLASNQEHKLRVLKPINPYGNDLVMKFHIEASGSRTLVIRGDLGGTYLYDIDWGDGTVETDLTVSNPSHTYAGGIDPVVRISGLFSHLSWNSMGNSALLIKVLNHGSVGHASTRSMYFGCNNLISIDSFVSDFSASVDFYAMFANCFSLTEPPDLSFMVGLKPTDLTAMFYGLIGITRPPQLGYIDPSEALTMASMLGNWQSTGEVDIPIDEWTVDKCTNFMNFLVATTLTTECYDRVLRAWSQQTLVNTTVINMGDSKYSDVTAHADMIAAMNGFDLIDGGLA